MAGRGRVDPHRHRLRGLGLRHRQGDRRARLPAASSPEVILTHFHEDHTGAAAEISTWGDVLILAHRLEAPIIRGKVPAPPPNYFTEEDRALHERIARGLPPAPAARVDRELDDGDLIDFGGGASVVATPGHTDGSIAIHLHDDGILFTGDTVAQWEGEVVLGPFNLDRGRAIASFRRLSHIDVDVACFGHGAPLLENASSRLRAAAAGLDT